MIDQDLAKRLAETPFWLINTPCVRVLVAAKSIDYGFVELAWEVQADFIR